MSDINKNNSMTMFQIKKQLKSIHTDRSDIKNSLLNLLEQSHYLDNIAKSIGLVKDGFLFVNRISWKTILLKLEQSENNKTDADSIKLNDIIETVSQSSRQLEHELIPQLQKLRNNWMLEVIVIEFVLLGLLSLVIAAVMHIQGWWDLSDMTIAIQPFLYERPIFSLMASVMVFLGFLVMHFSIRNFVAEKFVRKLKNKSSEFDLASAFLKNTRIQHSIFRPDIIGWGWLNQKRWLNQAHR